MKVFKLFAIIIMFVVATNVFANVKEDTSYSIVIYQGNCTSHAVMYEVTSSKKFKVAALAYVNSISNEQILGKNCNLKFNDGSVSMIDLCIEQLKNDYIENYDITEDKNELINVNSIIVGIAGYTEYKDEIYDKQVTKLAHLKNSLIATMQNYSFNCANENIQIMHDIDLINAVSVKLVEYDIMDYNPKGEDIKNIWTFFLSSLTVGICSKRKLGQYILDKFLYLENIGGGYYNLGKDSSSLFADIKDKNSPPTNKVQQIISESDLGEEIFDKRGYTFSYWLQENKDKPTYRNNARGLAVMEYALNKKLGAKNREVSLEYKPSAKEVVDADSDEAYSSEGENMEEYMYKLDLEEEQDKENPSDAAFDTLKSYVDKIIDESTDMLIQTTTIMEDSDSESGETEASTESGIILVFGDLFNYDFIIKRYEQQLNNKISDPVFRSKIHLINMDDFMLGLVLASEKFK